MHEIQEQDHRSRRSRVWRVLLPLCPWIILLIITGLSVFAPEPARVILSIAGAVGAGVIAGVFFAFSTFVMRALARLPAAEGIAAMQAINIVVINPVFLGVLFGTGAVSVVAVFAALLQRKGPDTVFLLSGCALYLIGTLFVTIAFNVPLNNALARVKPDDPDAPQRWADYVRRWTAWNHVRTVAAILAMSSFIMAIRH
ncbi:MAG: DUF1772 domain-containing protein [Tepidisphaeraceae bacterium]